MAEQSRLLGVVGLVGGLSLLVAFLTPVNPNELRLLAFNAGAIAIAVWEYRTARQRPVANFMLVAAGAVIIANALYATMVLLALSSAHPAAGTFGFTFFAVGAAMWLADAWLGGALTMRAGGRGEPLQTLAGLALLVGSLLAFTGMDRLGLAHPDGESVFTTASLIGIFFNGLAWVALGAHLIWLSRVGLKTPPQVT